jgi:hypothetical protein
MGDGVFQVAGSGRVHDLAGLAARCRAAEAHEWPAIVARHLDGLEAARPRPPAAFAAAREDLRVLLRPAAGAGRAAVVRWRVAEDLEAHLVRMGPDGPAAVDADDAAAWGRSRDELWHLGLDNVRGDGAPRPEPLGPAPGVDLVGLRSPSPFTATHALWMERSLGAGPHGVLLAVPSRRVLVAHAVRDGSVVPAVDVLVKMAVGFHREEPEPLSPHLYWVRDGAWSRQRVEAGDREATFTPSASFARLVSSLRAP